MRWVLQLCTMLAIACMSASQAQAPAKRVALVIGESAYRTVSPLANPGADARLVADALARAGFDVRLGLDLDKAGLETALDDFARDAQVADVAAVYFAGHGFETGGRNWLVPVDAAISGGADVQTAAVPFEAVARSLSGARVKLVALDACRDNPFAARAAEGGVINRGLAEVEVDGYVIIYAAGVGATALDGVGNSPFAQSYARWVSESNVDLRLLAGRIRDDVTATTGGKQRPFVSASLSGQETVLAPAPAGRVRGAATTRERPSAYFEFARRVSDPSCFQTRDVKCVTKWTSLSSAGLVTLDDDGKLRVWAANGAALQRAIPLANPNGRLWSEGPAFVASGEVEFEAIFSPAPVTVTPLDGRAPTVGRLQHHGGTAPVLREVRGASPRAVFSYPESCTLGIFDLRTFRAVGPDAKGARWIPADAPCGEGTVDWVFGDDASDRIIAGVHHDFRGDRTSEVLLLSAQAGTIACRVGGGFTDAAFNDLGGFHVAGSDGPIVAYDRQCRVLRTDRHHRALVTEVFPFDAAHMMSRSVDGDLKVWTAARGVVTRTLAGLPRSATIQHVRGQDGVLILNEDKRLYIWNGEPRLGAYVGPSAPVCQGMLSEDGDTLYARRCDGALEVWRRRAA